MSIRDNSYTNPDNLRSLYRSPKNPLRDVDDAFEASQILTQTSPTQPVSVIPGGGSGSGNPGGGGSGGGGCPALGQLTFARYAGSRTQRILTLVDFIKPYSDYLWDPIDNLFKQVEEATHLPDTDCVEYETTAGGIAVVSLSQPVIQTLDDKKGRPIVGLIAELLDDQDLTHKAVSLIRGRLKESEIKAIRPAGKHTVVHISLKGGGIYCFGSNGQKMNVGHNVKPRQDDFEAGAEA